jgi:hypothetical protein
MRFSKPLLSTTQPPLRNERRIWQLTSVVSAVIAMWSSTDSHFCRRPPQTERWMRNVAIDG